jgi:phosphopantothenoylcysteine synthetase/decarboxylase
MVSPAGAAFADRSALEAATGHPVIGEHRKPGTPRRDRPAADAVVIAPATANTVCKLGAGIADTYALDVASECIGLGVPTVIVPFANRGLTDRTPFRNAVSSLRMDGVAFVKMPPHEPHHGGPLIDAFPWKQAMARAAELDRS